MDQKKKLFRIIFIENGYYKTINLKDQYQYLTQCYPLFNEISDIKTFLKNVVLENVKIG